jgi:hypothetical protein
MSILTIAEARALITTALDDTNLATVIEREEELAVWRCGPPGDGTTEISEAHEPEGRAIYLRLPIESVTSVTEDGTTVATTEYVIWPKDGRIKRTGQWRGLVEVTYVPQDTTALWKAVMVELVRLALEQTAMMREEVTQEYRYEAASWESARERLYRRLNYLSV